MKDVLQCKYSEIHDVLLEDLPSFEEWSNYQNTVVETEVTEDIEKKLSGSCRLTGVGTSTMPA